MTKEASGGRWQAGETAYLNLIWLCPARLTLRMDLLSQFDIYHPAPNSSYPSSTWGILQKLNSFAKGYTYLKEFWQLFHDDGKEPRQGNPSLLQLLFDCGKTSKNPVFDQFLLFLSTLTFQSIVHYAKRLDVVGEKVRAICTAELLKVAAESQFSIPLPAECPSKSQIYSG